MLIGNVVKSRQVGELAADWKVRVATGEGSSLKMRSRRKSLVETVGALPYVCKWCFDSAGVDGKENDWWDPLPVSCTTSLLDGSFLLPGPFVHCTACINGCVSGVKVCANAREATRW